MDRIWTSTCGHLGELVRYADDFVILCRTKDQAQAALERVRQILSHLRLELHPTKTKIVYCKDDDRRGNYLDEKFDYLGYTFRARRSKNRWGKILHQLQSRCKQYGDPGDPRGNSQLATSLPC